MADITITATNVKNGGSAGTFEQSITFGETVTAGMPLYAVGDGTYKKALNDTSAHAACVGVALSGGNVNQRGLMLLSGGILDTGATLVIGTTRWAVSANAGGIAPVADLTGTGKYVTWLGYTTTTGGKIQLVIEVTGLTLA